MREMGVDIAGSGLPGSCVLAPEPTDRGAHGDGRRRRDGHHGSNDDAPRLISYTGTMWTP